MKIIEFVDREPIGSSTYPLPDQLCDLNLFRAKLQSHEKKQPTAILYVHVPFCDQICSFCGFSRLIGHDNLKSSYVDALLREMTLYSDLPYIQSLSVESVFLGGGTANSLSPAHLDAILGRLKKSFNLADDCEMTCEGTPQNFTDDRIEILKKHNVSRASAGIQTFDRGIRTEHMNMRDGKDELLEYIDRIRKHFPNFNLDFIYNLPGHTDAIWEDDLETAIKSGAKHLTIYPLVLLNRTIFNTDYVKKNRFPPPDRAKEIKYFQYTMERLSNSIYTNKYSVNDWSVPGCDSRYIIEDAGSRNVIALGSVGHGYLNGMVYKNIQQPIKYIETVMKAGSLPVDMQRVLTGRELMERYMVMGLRLKKLSLAPFYEFFGERAEDVFAFEIAEMCENGYLRLDGDTLIFTEKGDVWQNNVRSHFEKEKIACVGYSDTIGIGASGKDHYVASV